MDLEVTDNLANGSVPAELQSALRELAQALDRLGPSLSESQARRNRRRMKRIALEATDSAVDAHWWEVYLDLLSKTATEAGESGLPVLTAIQRLRPLMAAQLGPYEDVTLQPITEDTVWGICQLSDTLTEPRKNFVATNAVSLAQAHFNKYAWFRAIYAGKAPVGFMMLYDDDEKPEYFLWRLMIAEPYQGRGYGRHAIRRLVEYVKTRPHAAELLVSCGEGEGSPKGFYLKQGFVPTGAVEDDETVLRLTLD